MKEVDVLFNNTLNTFLFTVIWHWAHGQGLERREQKPTATTSWAKTFHGPFIYTISQTE